MSLLSGPTTVAYKPMAYSWAYDYWKMQHKVHWLAEEVPMQDDVKDWRAKLTADEKTLLTQIFRFFVNADIQVSDAYSTHYIPRFKHTEILMMLKAFSDMESVHVDAYSNLIETVGLPEIEYSRFLEYKEMVDKQDFAMSQNSGSLHDLVRTMAVFGAFTEGLQLYSSFCILLNFPRFNKMKGMGQIISWSARDEGLHCLGVLKLLHTLVEENPSVWTQKLKDELTEACRTIVTHEDAFIDLAFDGLHIEGITGDDVKAYIRYVANRRLIQLNLEPIYDQSENPVPWMDEQLNNLEHANFFETRSTEYSKASMEGTWNDDAFNFE